MVPIVGMVVLRAMGAMLMFSRSVVLRTMGSRLVMLTPVACGVSRPKIGLGRGCTVALPVYLKTKTRLGRNVPIKS